MCNHMASLLEQAKRPVPTLIPLLARMNAEIGARRRRLPLSYRASEYTLHNDVDDAERGGYFTVEHPTDPMVRRG